jgi:hypothetical protein
MGKELRAMGGRYMLSGRAAEWREGRCGGRRRVGDVDGSSVVFPV